ncbi:ABC transporter permease [Ideonella sp. BN130291]|uniref:ABC transporter permease n=1 Tax=Ideonella sp. BN130291 TaxID=3112940 RepID=UPI002E26F670|nr:ABC transporter permease [Ideonella sp. BN130291]
MKERQVIGVAIAVLALVLFGSLRYEHFASGYNLLEFTRYNAMFTLISIGMAFVILSGGIDLSVGSVAALASVVSALLSGHSAAAAVAGGVGAGLVCGLLNGLVIARLHIQPFITTLAMTLAAHGAALLLADNQPVSVSYDTGFTEVGQGDWHGLPVPLWVAAAVFVAALLLHRYSRFGRHSLAIGGNAEAARLMGLNVERNLLAVYALSGALAGLAGVLLAAQGSGQPNEGLGWDLFAISAVVVGGTLLTGGMGSVGATLLGVLLLGLVFNLLNFENGLGQVTLSSYWQSVVRGVFLLAVVLLQVRLARKVAPRQPAA